MSGPIWQPHTNPFEPSLDAVVESYQVYLEMCAQSHLKAFVARRQNSLDSAVAEAAVFAWLRARRLNPSVYEDPGRGGPDFVCRAASERTLFVEVTALDGTTTGERSGWSAQEPFDGRWFSDISDKLDATVGRKAPQMSGRGAPRVLVICLRHVSAGCLLSSHVAAEYLMTSPPHFSVPLSEGTGEMRVETDLRNSAFLVRRMEGVALKRKSISALLLASIWDDKLELVGMLHPKPAVEFDWSIMPEVPFLRLEWPVRNDALRTEWVIAMPQAKSFYHLAIEPTDDELRGNS